jgi:choline dehydrogenase
MPTWDWIVVGGGSAGCAVAARLSEQPGIRVLLVEAGRAVRPLGSRVPAAFNTMFRGACDWAFETAPEPQLDGRRLFWPRGKLLGGSSAINAMIWTRGHPGDFDAWEAAGGTGWGWDAVRPWFERIAVRPTRHPAPNPLSRAFVEALVGLGLRRNDGFNTDGTEGAGFFDLTIRDGERESAARAYLDPARRRSNLTVRAGALVSRVVFQDQRAVGIDVATGDTTTERLGATRGIVLAAGAIGSPALLWRSGIGPADDLRRLAVPCIADRPGVGENLSDHLACGIAHSCPLPVTLEGAKGLLPLTRWLLRRQGPLTSNIAEAGAFLRVRSDAPVPDLELLTGPVWFVDHGFRKFAGHGFTVAAIGLQPFSRGRVRLHALHPASPPVIQPNYLSDERDLPILLEGIKRAREIVAQPSYEPYRGTEALPGPAAASDEAIVAHIRRESQTLYHPAGTCRMGSDADAVVDPSLRVLGVERLRVADASVMPTLVSAHPNAAVVMIGERCAGLLKD